MKKVLIGISGGVDSAVAAYLLKEKGYEVIGVTFLLYDDFKYSIDDAKKVCDSLNIKHIVADWRSYFNREIIDYFVKSYQNGLTPNPCIKCNEKIKYGKFLKLADDIGADYIATGHYAKKIKVNDYYSIERASSLKDQSYFLYRLNQNVLKRVLFPLFEISEKEETRDIARKLNLFVAEKKDSQEICFINDSYREFLKDKIESKKTIGNFIDLEGNILGKHEGIWNYTIGQRKGLNIAFGKPMYVVSIDSDSKNVVLGSNEDLYVSSLTASSINWIFEDAYKRNEDVDIKIRYNGSSVKGRFELIDEKVNVTFYEPVRAVTSGQSVVFYKDNILLGGGII